MNLFNQDTIVALSTPKGVGAIAIVRVSGKDSFDIVNKIVQPSLDLCVKYANKLRPFKIIHKNRVIDRALIVQFFKPRSFTGEDLVEIHCHGSEYIVQEILNSLIKSGARIAEPGEFTRRSFINGKIDLSQAEAIGDIIQSKTKQGLDVALSNLSGQLSNRLKRLRNSLKKQYELLVLELDFSEDIEELANRNDMIIQLKQLRKEIQELIKSFTYGKIVTEGANVAIVGRTNVGKSSLLNRLLNEERAIVSKAPGTTRDSISEQIDINGYLIHLFDTAGYNTIPDEVEKEGIKRTEKIIQRADIKLLLLDASKSIEKEDVELLAGFKKINNVIPVLNKCDQKIKIDLNDLQNTLKPEDTVHISAKTGYNIETLKEKIINKIKPQNTLKESAIITKVRHKDALEKTLEALNHSLNSLQKELSAEFIALDLKDCLDQIGQITGEITTEEILNDVFEKFCIGK